jgi:UDP-N-acetylglucosamine 2-epimerase
MKVLTIVGARPQFIKASAISRELRRRHHEVLVHTGQHYDYAMSGVFFDRLEIPAPDVNLEVGSGSHGAQTGAMLERIEQVLMREKPRWVLVYGDTNSTLAGALAAAKLHLPIAHVEAGLRSFNRRMPEEINRVVTDHLSDLLFCPSATAIENLVAEGVTQPAHVVGDVMLDVLDWAQSRPKNGHPDPVERMGMTHRRYLLATVHRSENTDDSRRLLGIIDALNAAQEPVVFPAHPRAAKMLAAHHRKLAPHVKVVAPLD